MDKLSTLHFMEKSKKYDEAVKWTNNLQNFVIEIFDLLTVGKSNRTYESPSQACIIIKREIKELLKKHGDKGVDYDGVLLGRRGDIKKLLNKVVHKKHWGVNDKSAKRV